MLMGEASEEREDWYIKSPLVSRPHTSLGIPSSSPRSDSGDCQFCFGSADPQWRSSSKYIDPGYGYEKLWRSSRAKVQGGGDSHFGSAAPVACEEKNRWRSSIRYINPGSGCWSAAEWRSSIKTVRPASHDVYAEWRPRVRVFKLSDCCTEWRMTGKRHVPAATHTEPLWRSCRGPGNPPPLKWVPPFRNLRCTPPKNRGLRKKVPSYSRKHPQLQLFTPSLETSGRSPSADLIPNAREIRAKVAAYFKLHPPLHLFSTSLTRPSSESKGSLHDVTYHAIRRFIPEGHEDHLVSPGCFPHTMVKARPSKIWCATGPQHDPASLRNVINGKVGPSDNWKPPKVTLGPCLLAPAGSFNKNVIDSCFAGPQNMPEPGIPSYSSQLAREAHATAHEDFKRNFLSNATSEHLKGYLYESNNEDT